MDEFKTMAKALKINALAVALSIRLPVTVHKKLLSELLKEADIKLGLVESQDLEKHFKTETEVYESQYRTFKKQEKEQTSTMSSGHGPCPTCESKSYHLDKAGNSMCYNCGYKPK